MPSPSRIGVYVNAQKSAAIECAQAAVRFLRARGHEVIFLPENRESSEFAAGDISRMASGMAFAIVFGGDGTLLAAARLLAPHRVPLLSVHLGRFGFITEVAPESVDDAVERALSGECEIFERLLLEAVVISGDGEESPSEPILGVNDAVVTSKAVRMVQVSARVDDVLVATYAADGVIVATPTGSTGYSLSAGGPLVHPDVSTLIVTPIAPHTLSARALLVPQSAVVEMRLDNANRDDAIVTIDGQIERALSSGDRVIVRQGPCRLRLLGVGGPGFYEKVRSRWHLGERRAE